MWVLIAPTAGAERPRDCKMLISAESVFLLLPFRHAWKRQTLAILVGDSKRRFEQLSPNRRQLFRMNTAVLPEALSVSKFAYPRLA